MTASRCRRAALAALACAAATASVASGQGATLPAGNFGGGAIAVPVSENSVAKDMLLAIRALPDGRAGVDGRLPTRCGEATIKGDTKLAADGSFTLRAGATRKPLLGVTETSSFVVRGTLGADGGTGSARATLRVRSKGRAARTCRSRTVSWTVRRPPTAPAAPTPAPADAVLYGLTSQEGPNAKRPIVLHATSGGRSIDRLVMGFRATCDRRRVVVADESNFSPEFDVAADGSFRSVERFKVTYSDVILRTTVVVRGQFDTAGAVAGKLAVTERFTSRKSGKSVDVCTTGTLSWSARA